MTVGRTFSIALAGMTGAVVEVEADIASGLPAFVLIGLPDAALGESRDRVRSAASNAGCALTQRKLTVNLSPAALPKHGSVFDLAIAMASLAAAGDISRSSVARVVHLGELGLDGRVRSVTGILPAVVASVRAGFATVMVPAANAAEASLVTGARVVPVRSLREAAIWHGGDFEPLEVEAVDHAAQVDHTPPLALDMADVVGNRDALDALMVAAAGGHHLLMVGPPGAGKTMLAARLPGILPDLDDDAALEVTAIRSLAGQGVGSSLVRRPPFEAPHHTATAAAIVGGGSGRIRPGAAVRASHGVLFLDEAPEFAASVLDVLRQPLESGTLTIHRANAVAEFPARFQLVLAANPCPCGNYGSVEVECTCSPILRRRYLGRLSGPLVDRIDIHLTLRRASTAALRLAAENESLTSTALRGRVQEARAIAASRLRGTNWRRNCEVPGPWLRQSARSLGPATTAALDRALERGAITMRGYDRALRVAWSISDLDGCERPSAHHVGHALFLRRGASG